MPFISEEMLYSDKALWISPDGQNVAFLTVNDTDVEEIMVGLGGNNFTKKVTMRYPLVSFHLEYDLGTI